MVLENYYLKNVLKKVISAFLMFALVTSAFFGCAEISNSDDAAETTAQNNEQAKDENQEKPQELIEVKPDPPAVAASKLAIVKRDFTKETFAASNGCELPYRLFIPIDYDESYAYPVLLTLHGMGNRGTDNEIQLEGFRFQEALVNLDHQLNRCIIVAPQCPHDDIWVRYMLAGYSADDVPMSSAMEALVELLDYIDVTYSTHPGRKYVIGASMGGFGTWDIITRYPDKFAAAVPICGGGDPAYAYELKDMYIHVYHDVGDDTIPVIAARRMVDAIKAVGGERIEYTETTGYGHGIAGYILNKDDLSIYDWLFSKVKDGYVTVEE